jgi:hypothetical protein
MRARSSSGRIAGSFEGGGDDAAWEALAAKAS